MPGDREKYKQAMNAGHSAAFDKDWQTAIGAYGRAVQEMSDDADAHIYLGMVLLQAGRLEDALKVYTRAHQISSGDPIPLEKSADVLRQMGRLKEAAQQYVNVAEIYLSQKDITKAISTWRRATSLTPGLVQIHAKLASAYERIGDNKKSIREYIILAYNFQRARENDKARRALDKALTLERRNVEALNAMQALTGGRDIQLPPPDESDSLQDAPVIPDKPVADTRNVGEADPRGPIGEAMSAALGILAGYVIEGGNLDASGGDALQAMELQRQGLNKEAIDAYLRAESRLRHPALKMNLGALLVLTERYEEATKHLGEATLQEQLAAGAYHAMGKAYFGMGKLKQASRYLIQSIQSIDTSLAADSREAEQLMSVYEQVLSSLESRDDQLLSAIIGRFIEWLNGPDWKRRIPETRRQLQEAIDTEGEQGLLGYITNEQGKELTDAVTLIDRYIRQGLLTLAMDESHRAIEFAPTHLPVHVRMAEIMMREGRVRQAISKYNIIANTYLVRGENERAASILREVLELAPLDIDVRNSLIGLLESEERWEEALEQYMDLADTYHQLGNFDASRDTYNLAERLATKVSASKEKQVRIKHRLADIDLMRLDMRKAQKTYEEIIKLEPEDERAHRALVDINYRLNNNVDAIKILDKLLGIYARKKQANQIVKLLEEQVTLYPNDTNLLSRMAAIYRQTGRKQDAITQLDKLGALQLDAGLTEDAANTIRQIITLNPDGVEEYKKLLSQLGG